MGDVRQQLLGLDGVLVWVDPVAGGKTRANLDPLLREITAHGVWVSTHPDIILKMGTKDVLVKTREMAWGSDCKLYWTREELAEGLVAELPSGPRVLKQHTSSSNDRGFHANAYSFEMLLLSTRFTNDVLCHLERLPMLNRA